MIKLLVRTTSTKFNALSEEDKLLYQLSLVFLTDTQLILVDGVYYGMSSDDTERLSTVIDKVDNISYFGKISDGITTYELLPKEGDDKPYKASLQIKGVNDALVTVDELGFKVNVSIEEGTELGCIKVNDKEVKVHGIDTAAYKPESYFYTSENAATLEEQVTTAESNIETNKQDIQTLNDTKVSEIIGNQVITVDKTNVTTPNLGFKVDNSNTEIGAINFTISDNGLSGKVDVPFKNVSETDNILTLADNGYLSANVSVLYLREDKKIYLYGKNNTVIGQVDTTDFIKDGMLNSARLTEVDDKGIPGTWLELVWNVDAGSDNKPMYVDVSKLVDLYDGSKINLVDISIAKRGPVTNGMSVDEAIGNIILDIQDAKDSSSESNDTLRTDFEAFKDRTEGFATSEQGAKADSAIQSINEMVEGDYITIGSTVTDNNIELVPVLKVGEMSKEDKGLAEVTDVKDYINEILTWTIL